MNVKSNLIWSTLLLVTLTSTMMGQSSGDVSAKQSPTKTIEHAVNSPATVKDFDLLDDARLVPVGKHYCSDKSLTIGSPCGSDKYGSMCCEKGESCLTVRYNEDATGMSQVCCQVGWKWCTGGHGLNGGCTPQSKACPSGAQGTVR